MGLSIRIMQATLAKPSVPLRLNTLSLPPIRCFPSMRPDQRLLYALLVAMAGLLPVAASQAQAPIPKLVAGINDPGRVLSAQQSTDLNKKLAAFEQQKDFPIVVLIVNNIDRANLISYTEKAMAAWTYASGSSGRVVLLVVFADRENARIEQHHTALELATAQRIIFETMVPRFKAGHDIAGGIAAGLDQLLSVLNGNPLPPPPPEPQSALNSLMDRLDTFRYSMQDKSGSGHLFEMLGFAVGVAFGFGVRPFAGRWLAALLAATVAGIGSWLQYGFIVPYAMGAFVIVIFGWKHWLGKGGSSARGK